MRWTLFIIGEKKAKDVYIYLRPVKLILSYINKSSPIKALQAYTNMLRINKLS